MPLELPSLVAVVAIVHSSWLFSVAIFFNNRTYGDVACRVSVAIFFNTRTYAGLPISEILEDVIATNETDDSLSSC